MALAERMERGVEVRDRHWHLKRYTECFVGREAVTWLVHTAGVVATEEAAVALGNAMMQLGLLAHVVRPLWWRFMILPTRRLVILFRWRAE